jgi:hypothetical protein
MMNCPDTGFECRPGYYLKFFMVYLTSTRNIQDNILKYMVMVFITIFLNGIINILTL